MTIQRRWASLLVLVAAAAAHAQGTISQPPATLVIPADHFDTTPAGELTGVGTPPRGSQLFEAGWWYRIVGDSHETPLPPPDAQTYEGNLATFVWNDLAGRGISIEETLQIHDAGLLSGSVSDRLVVTNRGGAPLQIALFHMLDFDLTGSPGDDSAVLSNEGIAISDAQNAATYLGLGAAAYFVRTYDEVDDVAGLLSDGSITDFDDSGLPLGPADVTAGYQWNLVLGAGESLSARAVMAANTPVEICGNCLDDDDDGLVDFEDDACCSSVSGALLELRKGSLTTTKDGSRKVKLKGVLSSSILPGPPVSSADAVLDMRTADGAVVCARVPASTLVRKKAKLTFRGATHDTGAALRLARMTIRGRKDGSGRFALAGRADLAEPQAGALAFTLALRNPATAEDGNVCAHGTAAFRPTRKGLATP
jgi:hypothetical protein